MLLGSPHFSSFLNDMGDSLPALSQQPQQQQQQQQPQQAKPQPQPTMQAMPQEANANRQDYQMQQNPQANMVMVPNQGMDPNMGMNNAGWNSGIDMNFGNASVFAVMEVPEGPVLDAEVLSGKSSFIELSENSKNDVPVVSRPASDSPQSDIGVANPDVEIDESDPAFALFVDSPAPATSHVDLTFEGVSSEKASQFELVVDNSNVSTAAKKRFDSLCLSIDAAFERVSAVTSHLQ